MVELDYYIKFANHFLLFFQLSDIDIQRLYKIYENDFKLFGYSFRIRNMKFNY